MPERPLSPHFTVYRFKYTMATSFLNRITGVALSFGLVPLVCWLVAVAAGARAQARAERWLGSPLMKLVYAGLVIAFCYHLVAGIRHLIFDTGRGLERAQARRSAWLIAAASIILILAVGGAWLAAGRGAP